MIVADVDEKGGGEPCAAGVVYVASDDARLVTGTELVIDGGVMAG